MKRKAYIVPAVEEHEMSIEGMICRSIIEVDGSADVTSGDDSDPGAELPGGADSRRHNKWDDEEEQEEKW